MGNIHIGMIAPEFPPEIGGMHTLAYGFAEALSSSVRVSVYTPTGLAPKPGPYDEKCVLTGRLSRDTRRLAGEPIDVWLGMNAGLLPLLARLPGARFIYVHGKDFLTPWISYGPWWMEALRRPRVRSLRKAIRRQALVRCRNAPLQYFTNSRYTASLAAERLGIPAAKITVCPPGVDDRFFQTKGDPVPGRLRIVTVSRLSRFTRRKNIDGVIRAIAMLRRDIQLEYVVVGDGDDRSYLESVARDLGVADIVTFKGRLSADDLIACYREADLFVLAANATPLDFEGFGIVYLEACAAGVPVLCSAAGGATDAVEDGRNGILIQDSSPEAIASGIRRFVVERHRFREDDIRAWAERYRWPRVTDLLLTAIRDRSA